MNQIYGKVFNIQSYSIHDGPGIRTTVFVKGCPLRCKWCQNPESQRKGSQLMYYRDKCRGCGRCILACNSKAIFVDQKKVRTDRTLCSACGKCVGICDFHAREVVGKRMSVNEVMKIILEDRIFLENSGGGMTISGGEPLMQPEFSASLFHCAHRNGLHTAIETCNYALLSVIDQVYRDVDLALCDIKCMDPVQHKMLTGVSNESILSNIIYIRKKLNKEMCIRLPVIPGYNDSDENILETARFIHDELGSDVELHLLPYNKLGESKADSLELEDYALGISAQNGEKMKRLQTLAESYVKIVKNYSVG